MMKRFLSLVLSATMVFSNITYIKSIKAEASVLPTIEFVGNRSATSAEIIEGNSVEILARNTDSYLEGEPVFGIENKDGTGTANITYEAPDGSSKKGTIKAEANSQGTYGIKGNYFSRLEDTVATETWKDEKGVERVQAADVKLVTMPAVIRRSKVTIVANADEDGSLPGFSIERAKGIFEGYETAIPKRIENGKGIKFLLKKTSDSDKVSDSNFFELVIYPTQVHKEVRDDDGNIDQKAGTYIKEGTKFTIDIGSVCATDLLLKVYTAEQAQNAIASAINDDNKCGSYIVLKDDDTLNWITNDFVLNNKTSIFGADIDIEWKWLDKSGADLLGTGIQKIEKVQKTSTVLIDKQMEDDVSGQLVAEIHCNSKLGDIKRAEVRRDITIKGKGKPAYLDVEKHNIGGTITPIDSIPNAMDVYDGTVDGYDYTPKFPYEFYLRAYMGEKNGKAEYLKVTSTNPDAIEMYVDGIAAPSSYGGEIKPLQEDATSVPIMFKAVKNGTVQFTFEFFGKGNGGKIESFGKTVTPPINVEDNRPSEDITLKSLDLFTEDLGKYDIRQIEYDFSSTTTGYEIHVPNKAEEVTFKPVTSNINARVEEVTRDNISIHLDETTGYTDNIDLKEQIETTIRFKIKAQHPKHTGWYTVRLIRDLPSDDSSLKTLEFFTENKYGGEQLLEGFNPDVSEYSFDVPFKINKLRVNAVANSIFRESITFNPPLEELNLFNKFVGFFTGDKNKWIELKKPNTEPEVTTLTTTVMAEDGKNTTKYVVNIKRLPPSRIATLDGMQITDYLGEEIKYIPDFNTEIDSYDVNIPYITKYLKFNVKPTDEAVSEIICADVNGNKLATLKPDVLSKKIPVPYMSSDLKPYVLNITVIPESEEEADAKIYKINVMREPPSNDGTLKELLLKDQNGKKIDLDFFSNIIEYQIEVPYEVDKVAVTPTASFESVDEITVNGRKVVSGNESSPIRLSDYPSTSQIVVKVVAEDTSTKTNYKINIKRQPPSNDSLLKSLTITGVDKLDPIFIPDRYSFDAKTLEGINKVKVTPTAKHPKAIIKVNGRTVASGSASEDIDLLYIDTDIKIEVTAQNGTTKSTYTISVKNDNLVEKTDDATLKRLKIEHGYIEPEFKPSTTEYKVYVKADDAYIEFKPKAYDSLAEIKVFHGKKEIGDDEDNYSDSLDIGENDFSIEVTSSDKTKTKKYEFTVYRDDEENLGPLKPVSPDDIDYENDKNAIVDITKYSIISADVFNTLREYPDNTITFTGNDYSLKFKGSDITKLVPHSRTYDLGMTFTLPDELEDDIDDCIYSNSHNRKLRPVYMHFYHHGALPGKAIFSISLGRKYKNDILYWNYYNEERDRMDYYGYVETNSKGTFTVPIDHFSVYIITVYKIYNAENKAGKDSVGDLSKSIKTENPYTSFSDNKAEGRDN